MTLLGTAKELYLIGSSYQYPTRTKAMMNPFAATVFTADQTQYSFYNHYYPTDHNSFASQSTLSFTHILDIVSLFFFFFFFDMFLRIHFDQPGGSYVPELNFINSKDTIPIDGTTQFTGGRGTIYVAGQLVMDDMSYLTQTGISLVILSSATFQAPDAITVGNDQDYYFAVLGSMVSQNTQNIRNSSNATNFFDIVYILLLLRNLKFISAC